MQSTKAAELRTLLNVICGAKKAPPQAAIRLEHVLQDHKQTLVELLDDSPKNAEHRSTIQNGKTFINGQEYKTNKEFTKEAIFLSDQLKLEEYECSRLLLEGTRQANTTLSPALDTAVYLYHAERGYVLSILNTIFESIKDDQIDKHIRSVFLDYMAVICLKDGKGFISKILKTINDLNANIKAITKSSSQSPQEQQQQPLQQQPLQQHTFQQQPLQQQQLQQPDEPKFREDTIVLRIDQLKDERISLVQLLYHIVSFFWLSEADALTLITLVQTTNLLDPVAPYLLPVLLAAISPRWFDPNQIHYGTDISTQNETMKKINDAIQTKEWKVEGVKGTVLLQWALFNVKQPNGANHKKYKLDEHTTTSMAKKGIELGAFGFLNEYLLHFKQENGNMRPNINQIKESPESTMVIDGLTVDPNDYTKFHAGFTSDFQPIVEHELEYFAELFILKMSSLLHQLKTAEEDSIYQVDRSNEASSSYIGDSKNAQLEAFVTLLAAIYRDRPNAGVKFWTRENGLFAFVKWLFDVKVIGTVRAAFDFLGAISTGDQCASYAYEILSMGTVKSDIGSSHLFSWGKLFATLQFYANAIRKSWSSDDCLSIPETEDEVLCKLIYLCQQVVLYSSTARSAIWNDTLFATHTSIVNMISCPTSVNLRVHLYGLLTAFCSFWGGGVNGVGRAISFQVWSSLDQSDFILANKAVSHKAPNPTKDTSQDTFLSGLSNPSNTLKLVHSLTIDPISTLRIVYPDETSGFLIEFSSEKKDRNYTKTLAVLKLLASIIHRQSEKEALISGFSAPEQSIPPFLGHEYRSPGALPYLSLVIDSVFLNLNSLQFSNSDMKWKLADACLKIVENSIMSYNLDTIINHIKKLAKKATNLIVDADDFTSFLKNTYAPKQKQLQSLEMAKMLLPYVTHPGFDIMVRILSGNSFISEMFKIIGMGREDMSKASNGKNQKSFYLQSSLTRCLRIIHKAMTTQNAFANMFIPQLALCSEKLPAGEFKIYDCAFPQLPAVLTSVGKLMLFNTQVITQIALLVNADEHEELSALSVAILSALALEPEADQDKFYFPNHVNVPMGGIGTQLPSVLFASNEALSIIIGFSERLEIEGTETISYDNYKYDMDTIPFWLAEKTLGYDYSYEEEEASKVLHNSPSTRIAILDMLLQCMQQDGNLPTLTEFLLGYDVLEIASKGAQYKSIPASFEQNPQLSCLLSVLNMLRTSGMQESLEKEVFAVHTHPILAEKCHQLLYRLCSKESTSTATLHYLRTNGDDLLMNQLKSFAPRIEDHLIELEPCFSGIVSSMTRGDVQTDFITLKSSLDQRTWLLKLITLELHTRKVTGTMPLLDLLYGYKHTGNSLNSEAALSEQLRSMYLQMNAEYQQPNWNLLEFVNSLDFTWTDDQLYPASLQLTYFKDFDAQNYETKSTKLFDIQNVYRFLRHSQKDLVATMSEEENKAVEEEMGKILQSLMAQNRSRQIASSRLRCLETWEQLIEITLFDCFDSFPVDVCEKILNDLLSLIWTKSDDPSHDLYERLKVVVLAMLKNLKA